jgi:hypothetical protein
MLNIGEAENRDFERRHLGPRAPLETLLDIPESSEESTKAWIENCRRMCEQPKLTPNFDLAKAQAQQESERAETMKQWRARLDWLPGPRTPRATITLTCFTKRRPATMTPSRNAG